tara:strand:- start:25 stop:303 length:279 start_codon:yes stop_codon:yes gene_type:complete
MIREVKLITPNIFEFFNPEYLKICIWLSLNILIKKACVDTRKINGNISKSKSGEFKNEIYIGKYGFTLMFLKNSTSVKVFKIKTKLKKIIDT